MDGATVGWLGAIGGTLAGVIGAVIGCRASLRSAQNQAQKRFLWTIIGITSVLLVAFGVAVWLTALGIWPRWVYWLVMGAWFAGLGPAIWWSNRRLAAFSGPDQNAGGAPTAS
ncbi:MAG: hypothetical protein ACR2PO_06985 [Methyloligellaceae bacterium]